MSACVRSVIIAIEQNDRPSSQVRITFNLVTIAINIVGTVNSGSCRRMKTKQTKWIAYNTNGNKPNDDMIRIDLGPVNVARMCSNVINYLRFVFILFLFLFVRSVETGP